MQLTVLKQRIKPGPKQSIETSIQRFWSKVDMSTGRFGCWPWTGGLKEKNYGQVFFMGKSVRAHRLAYQLEFGEIPFGLFVCHLCDNPICCNPWHLTTGTAKQNTQDMIHKGRANFYHNLPNLRASTV
jgi:hypothetical protein